MPAPVPTGIVPASPAFGGRSTRVMVVDDAVVVRGLVSRWLNEVPGVEVVGSHRTGAEAVAAVERLRPDVVILDLEMPEMDGLAALPLILARRPGVAIIVASTLTRRGAEISLRCLALGAMDYIAKPSTNRDVTVSTEFRKSLVEKVVAVGQRALRVGASTALAARGAGQSAAPRHGCPLRDFGRGRAEALVIGASTGGPNAILELLALARTALPRLPVIIAQHMPATFTTMFAEHLQRRLVMDAGEAIDGEPVEAGRIYVAPGGRHLLLAREGSRARVLLDDGPPVNFCRPSVDVTFASAARLFGPSALGVVLTGMGNDGSRGAAEIVECGGSVIAQDEASSVVWGMPGSVARQGLCAAIQPIRGLAATIVERSGGARG
jgi:two-component system chemotaxis response regulator CheB